jgi:hypothetical protein
VVFMAPKISCSAIGGIDNTLYFGNFGNFGTLSTTKFLRKHNREPGIVTTDIRSAWERITSSPRAWHGWKVNFSK